MRVLRTLESLGAAVMREGVYLLPDTPANRQSLEALTDYITKISGSANVLQVNSLSPAQREGLTRLFDRSARYENLIKTVESLRVGFGTSDPSAISRVVHKQRREFEAIAALDFFPSKARERAQQALATADAEVKKRLSPGWKRRSRCRRTRSPSASRARISPTPRRASPTRRCWRSSTSRRTR